jgi:hypothetical protein
LSLDPILVLPDASAIRAVVTTEARIDFLTLWASSDGYIPMDFNKKFAKPQCATSGIDFWGVGVGPRLIADRHQLETN